MPAIDNFYLDANGILHKCTHGDAGESVAASIDDSLVLICRWRGSLPLCTHTLQPFAPALHHPCPASPLPSAATSTTWCNA